MDVEAAVLAPIRVSIVGPDRWTAPLERDLRALGWRITHGEVQDVIGFRKAPHVIVLGPVVNGLHPAVLTLRDRLPHVPIVVVPDSVLPLVSRVWMYDMGVAQIVDPPALLIELAARIRATQTDKALSKLGVKAVAQATKVANPREDT